MTQEQLSAERNHFSSAIVDPEEDFSTDITLETYLNATATPTHSSPFLMMMNPR